MSAKKPVYPKTVKHGFASVTIYEGESGGSPLYTLAWNEGGRRQRRAFRKPEKANAQADQTVMRLAKGHHAAAAMQSRDAEAYGLAVHDLAPLNIPLNTAIKEYVTASKILHGGSIIEAAKFYAERRPIQATTILPDVAVEEFLAAKKDDGVGVRYLQDARSRLRKFATAFRKPLAGITSAEMEQWLRHTAKHPRTRNNFRQHLVTLFRWARDRGYLPREAQTEADRLPSAKDRGGDVKVFSPSAISSLLLAADDTLRPYLAIRAFAGVRDSEMRRLTWENVRFDQKVIEIRAGQAKTASRRLIPILPNLAAWLSGCKEKTGRIGYANSERIARKVAANNDITWIHNGLRHGFGSHRLAVTKNAAQVAHEMGNTERMVHAHYKELVTQSEGKAWFAIEPERAKNVIPMKRRKAA